MRKSNNRMLLTAEMRTATGFDYKKGSYKSTVGLVRGVDKRIDDFYVSKLY